MSRTLASVAALLGLLVFIIPTGAQDEQTLVVFAASSLTNAFEEIGDAFEAGHPGVEVIFNFSGSSTLAAQIAEGAPADVFASADENQMVAVAETGRVAGAVETFVFNRLTLAVPADNPAQIESLHDLAASDVLLVLAARNVPVREYTDILLTRLAQQPDSGADFLVGVQENIVSEEGNVRQIVAKIVLGEADAGIVYQSDITPEIADSVTAIPIDDAINPLAIYPIAAIEGSAHLELARDFIEFTVSERGQDILAKWGFVPLSEHETSQVGAGCEHRSETRVMECSSEEDHTDGTRPEK